MIFWSKRSTRGRLLVILCGINLVIATINTFAGSLAFIFNTLIALICWLGTYDRRAWK